ncbi:MAG: hypothetical protein IJ491_01535 [Clostridia bacterium]|nr:hypothetical protein [Clostridia bacterium]
MDKEKNESGFSFSYSAGRQIEIDRIVSKYTDNKEDKFQQMKKLDDSVESLGTAIAIVYAIVSVLVFGAGMSFSLAMNQMVLGIVVGITGVVMLFFIAPVRRFVVKKRREKIAPKILELAEEISNLPG